MKQLKFFGFPPRLREEAALRKIFNTFGTLTRLTVNADQEPSSTVSGICRFVSAEDAETVLKGLNGLSIGDHILRLESLQSNGEGAIEDEELTKEVAPKKPKGKVGRPSKAKNPLFGKQSAKAKVESEEYIKSENDLDVHVESGRPNSASSDIIKGQNKSVGSDNESGPREKNGSISKTKAKALHNSNNNNDEKLEKPFKRTKSDLLKDEKKLKVTKPDALLTNQTSSTQTSKQEQLQSKDSLTSSKNISLKESSSKLSLLDQDTKGKDNRLSKAEELRLKKQEAQSQKEQAKAAKLKAKKDAETNLALFLKNAPTVGKELEVKSSAVQSVKEKASQSQNLTEKAGMLSSLSAAVSIEPSESKFGIANAKEALSAPDGSKPEVSTDGDVWEEYIDDTYGAPYYYNPETQETVWELPTNYAKIIKMGENESHPSVVNADGNTVISASPRKERIAPAIKPETTTGKPINTQVSAKSELPSRAEVGRKGPVDSVTSLSNINTKLINSSVGNLPVRQSLNEHFSTYGPPALIATTSGTDSLILNANHAQNSATQADRSSLDIPQDRIAPQNSNVAASISSRGLQPLSDLNLAPPPLLPSTKSYSGIQSLTGPAIMEEPAKRFTSGTDRLDTTLRQDAPKAVSFVRQDSTSSQSSFRQSLAAPPPAVVEKMVMIGEIINAKPTFGFIRSVDIAKTGTPQIYYHVDRCLEPVGLGDEVEYNVGWQSEKGQTYAFNVRKHRKGGYPLTGGNMGLASSGAMPITYAGFRGNPPGPITSAYVPYNKEVGGPSAVFGGYPPKRARSRERYAEFDNGAARQRSSNSHRSRSRSPTSARIKGQYPSESQDYEKPIGRTYPPLPSHGQDMNRWSDGPKPPHSSPYRRG